MNDTVIGPAKRLWTEHGFREDGWVHAEGAEALGENNARVILPLAAYLGLDEKTRVANAERLGVHVLPGEAIDPILPHLAGLALVSLAFPAFSDGRSYSKAQQLRTVHGYGGIIRAAGDVLIDQIPLMLRSGFTEFEVSNPTALKRLEAGETGGIPFFYQPTSSGEQVPAGYSWRRLPG